MGRLGITTVECKSGYGLDAETELRLLQVYKRLADSQPLRIVSTFLGAHIVPPEYGDNRSGYIDLLCHELIPEIARRKLAAFCDVFVESSAFTLQEAQRILQTARAHQMRPKVHADQFRNQGAAALAARLGAVSADHLEHVSPEGMQELARAEVTGVILPLSSLYLNNRWAPARALMEAGVRVAVATDSNPGTAPSFHLPLALTLACTLQRMTPAEALKGATIYAARALGQEAQVGSLEPGKAADFAIIDAPDVNHWLYHFRANACIKTVVQGAAIPATC